MIVTEDRLDDIKTKLERYRREREELDQIRQKFQGNRTQAKSLERTGTGAKENYLIESLDKRPFLNQQFDSSLV